MSSRLLRSLLASPGPTVAVTIASDHLAAVQLGWSTKSGPAVTAYARTTLEDGVVTPSVNGENIDDPDRVGRALREVLGRLPRRPTRVALVLPDSTAKVSLVRFDKVPARKADLDQLIRWQVHKAAPFRIEEAQVAYTAGARTPDGKQEYVVVLIRRDVVEQYEQVCTAAGAHAGCVDLASFNLINAALATSTAEDEESSDWLLVHVAPEYSTMAIVRGPHLIFYRNRLVEGGGNLVDLVHQTAMYYEDRLGGTGFSRAVLAGHSAIGSTEFGHDGVRRTLEERLQTAVEPLGDRLASRFARSTGIDVELFDVLAAPIGILLRDRHAH